METAIVWNSLVDAVKHIIGKSVTIYVTYLGGATVYPVAFNFVLGLIGQNLPVETDIVVKVLIYGGAYKIWTDGLIPAINSFFVDKGVAGFRGASVGYAKIF